MCDSITIQQLSRISLLSVVVILGLMAVAMVSATTPPHAHSHLDLHDRELSNIDCPSLKCKQQCLYGFKRRVKNGCFTCRTVDDDGLNRVEDDDEASLDTLADVLSRWFGRKYRIPKM